MSFKLCSQQIKGQTIKIHADASFTEIENDECEFVVLPYFCLVIGWIKEAENNTFDFNCIQVQCNE